MSARKKAKRGSTPPPDDRRRILNIPCDLDGLTVAAGGKVICVPNANWHGHHFTALAFHLTRQNVYGYVETSDLSEEEWLSMVCDDSKPTIRKMESYFVGYVLSSSTMH